MTDIFRPTIQPIRRIYDAFQDEAKNRGGKRTEEWMENERKRVWREARDFCQEKGLKFPTLDQVIDAEMSACGHVDYGSKWACRVSEYIDKLNK